jgi:hypothetical protein
MTYQIEATATGGEILVRHNEDGSISFIPIDESNSDYQEYLKHEATTK